MDLFRAGYLLATPDDFFVGGGLLVDDGCVCDVLPDARSVRARAVDADVTLHDLGDCVVAPGLVNAHAHLELAALDQPAAPAAGGFMDWIAAVLAQRRAQSPEQTADNVRAMARELLASGTTAVGEFDATGISRTVLQGAGLGGRVYREVLDGQDVQRTSPAIERLRAPLSALEGFGPHAAHTVSPELMGAIGALSRAHDVPISMHWAETSAEVEWLRSGGGDFARVLGASAGTSALDALESAGLLGAGTSLVHGNHPGPGEIERVARAGCVLVHCPGTHRYFEREPFALERFRAAGVPIALGSDSRASNTCLDMRHEMALVRAAWPALTAREVWSMATVQGARALQLPVGVLAVGARADFCSYELGDLGASGRDDVLEQLTSEIPPVLGTWVGAQCVFSRSAAAPEAGQTQAS